MAASDPRAVPNSFSLRDKFGAVTLRRWRIRIPGPEGTLSRFAISVVCVLLAGCHGGRPGSAPVPDGEPGASSAAGGEGRTQAPELDGRRVAQAEELLEGRFAGVRVIRVPGGIQVRIRGASSINGSNEPLYVVDGVEMVAGPGGALTGINPADITSIEVLKDIGSISAYGVRGANGVVLISTRRN